MAGRRLNPEEQKMWDRLAQTVTPLAGRMRVRAAPAKQPDVATIIVPDEPSAAVAKAIRGRVPPLRTAPAVPAAPAKPPSSDKLDTSWEKRITNGSLTPEMSVDLHGYTLSAAHQRLDQMLGMAISRNVRILLVVTGNPRPAPTGLHQERTRGAIRAEIGHWLALSRHADAIASVRTAHPRHGGKGALYIILRRGR